MKIALFTAILTSGFISLTMVTTVYFLQSKNSQRSIICGLLKVSRKGFDVLFSFASSSNLPSGHSEGQNEVGNNPCHDATLAADLHIAKTWILQSRFPMLFEAEILARMDNLLSFLYFLLILSGKAFREYGKTLFLKNLARL